MTGTAPNDARNAEDAPSEAASQSCLVVSLFGGVSLKCGHRDIAISNRKAKALLGYLALTPNLSETRERLVGVLWSETEESKARASLRQVLHALRDALAEEGFKGFLTDRADASFEPGSIGLDIAAVFNSIAEGKPHDLLLDRQRLTDTLMAGYDDIDPAFRIWLLAKRQSLHQRIVWGLESTLRESQVPLGVFERIARALQNLDPTHEEAARALIRARADAGDTGGALGIYKTLWEVLENEYDTEPSKPTQELITKIKLAQPLGDNRPVTNPPATFLLTAAPNVIARRMAVSPVAADVPRPPAEPKLVVSIGPFDASATREDQRYLVRGFRRELIASLVRFREWLVCDQATTASGSLAPSDTTSEFMIEASAFQVADGVRLVLMLRDTTTNAYLWSERFQISMINWFDAQQSVVRRLATALNVYLSYGRLAMIARSPASDLKAYDLWLQGQATILNFDPGNWHKAAEIFREVSGYMPEFAPAYSSLTQLHNLMHIVLPGVRRNAQRTAQALEYAREAARLDPIDSRSQLSLAWSHAMSKQYEQAEIYLHLANELNDNDPWTLISSANCFAFCGATEQADRLADYALSLPFAPSPVQWAYHAAIRFLGANYESCVTAASAAGDVNPNVPGYKAAALFHLGRRDEAEAEVQRFFQVIRGRWFGDGPASDKAITSWFLHLFPIKRPHDWERLRNGLEGAGAPVDGLAHDQW